MHEEPCGLREDLLEDADQIADCDQIGRPTNNHRAIRHISMFLLLLVVVVVLGIYLFTTNTQNAPGQEQVAPWRNIGQ
jgi:hypothetical protein